MRPLSYFELKAFSHWLQSAMEGAQLQNIWTNGEVLVFQFYKFKNIWLCFDLNQPSPQVIYLEKDPGIAKKVKPVTVFLNAHGKNLRWTYCQTDPHKGRVLEIELSGKDKACFIDLIAIPRAVNVLVKSEGKSISWEKPRELPPSQLQEEESEVHIDWLSRGLEWLQERTQKKSTSPAKAGEDPRLKALAKKRGALQKLEEQLALHPENLWQEMGEWLKTAEPLLERFSELYDEKLSRSENREKAFNKYKDLKRKRSGTEERLHILRKEILDLEKKISTEPYVENAASETSAARKIFEKTETRGRKLSLEGGFEAIIGRSAKDNLAILRQAQAWDLWLHLKDYPGAHAIILRPRNKEVPRTVLQKVSEWLISESFSGKKVQMGSHYDVVVVECRFVRPIKGDKLGRVTYHNPQVFSFASKS